MRHQNKIKIILLDENHHTLLCYRKLSDFHIHHRAAEVGQDL